MRLWLVLFLTLPLFAQVCRLSVAGLNRNRRVVGPVSAECPDPLHTAPFGNWGATSNFGPKLNGRQFDGWCHDMRVCDNAGNCRNACRDGWYEWNSCTTHSLYRPPNCTLFNDKDCTEQASPTGINVLGTQTVDVPVACPTLNASGDGFERGGCADVRSYSRSNNFMSLYELDPITGDELVQSLYFPSLLVPLNCTVWGCPAAGSDFVAAQAWESPAEPVKVTAEMAMVVNFGNFVDSANVCRIPALRLQAVSSANYTGPEIADGSLATLYTGDLTTTEQKASSQPLPTTLAGLQVRVVDSGGTTRNAGLVYTGLRQVNFVLPSGLRDGPANIEVVAGSAVRATGSVRIVRVQPGLYTADASGRGTAAAIGIRVASDGTQTPQSSFECADGRCSPVPLDMGSSQEQFVLSLFGTGIRNGTAAEATVAGIVVPVLYSGTQPTFAGLDQVNLLLPKSLAGRGIVEVRIAVDGRPANAVSVWLR